MKVSLAPFSWLPALRLGLTLLVVRAHLSSPGLTLGPALLFMPFLQLGACLSFPAQTPVPEEYRHPSLTPAPHTLVLMPSLALTSYKVRTGEVSCPDGPRHRKVLTQSEVPQVPTPEMCKPPLLWMLKGKEGLLQRTQAFY